MLRGRRQSVRLAAFRQGAWVCFRAKPDIVGSARTAIFGSMAAASRKRKLVEMGRQIAVVIYIAAMVAVVVAVDLAFLSYRFWARLTVNMGIVLVFVAFYLRFLQTPIVEVR